MGCISHRLTMICQGLKGWAVSLWGGLAGQMLHLHTKLTALDMMDRTDNNLTDLLNARLEMNLETDKAEFY